MRGKYQGFVLYIGKIKMKCNKNINCRGKRGRFYQLTVPAVLGFWQLGFARQKVNVPAIPRGWGRGNNWLVHKGVAKSIEPQTTSNYQYGYS